MSRLPRKDQTRGEGPGIYSKRLVSKTSNKEYQKMMANKDVTTIKLVLKLKHSKSSAGFEFLQSGQTCLYNQSFNHEENQTDAECTKNFHHIHNDNKSKAKS